MDTASDTTAVKTVKPFPLEIRLDKKLSCFLLQDVYAGWSAMKSVFF